jgi:hypothetical protein
VKLALSLFSAALLALSIGPTACNKQKPEGTNPPEDGDGKEAKRGRDRKNKGNDGGDGGGEGGEGGDGGEPATQSCEAKTADAPTPLFGEKVLIRTPVNVDLHEENPTFAVAQTTGGFVSACEGTVDRMTMLVFQNDKKKKLSTYADEFYSALEKNGYTGGTRNPAVVDSDTDHAFVAEYPAAGGQPASKMYIALKRRQDVIIALTFQTRPEEYTKLEPTFKASADSLLVAPPG